MFTSLGKCFPWIWKSPSPTTPKSSGIFQTQHDELRPILYKDSESHEVEKKRKKVRFALHDKVITHGAGSSKISPNHLVKMDPGTTPSPSSSRLKKQPKLGDHQKCRRPRFILYARDVCYTDSRFLQRRWSAAWPHSELGSCDTGPNEFITRENPLFVYTQKVSIAKDLSTNGNASGH